MTLVVSSCMRADMPSMLSTHAEGGCVASLMEGVYVCVWRGVE